MDHEDLEEIKNYLRRIHKWVVFIGVVTIFTILSSFCSGLVTGA
jgi:hypothetical protein